MNDDGLETIDITPRASEPSLNPNWRSANFWSGFRSGFRAVLAFPIRLLTTVWANGTILLVGGLAIGIGATFFLGILALVVLALLLCLLAIVLFAISFGFIRLGDWISGTKTLKFLPEFLQEAANKVNVSEDIGDIRSRMAAARNRRG